MKYSNIDFTVVYVDPSISTAGDGSTPAQALKDLPPVADMSTDTCYLIRRTSEDYACNLPSGRNNALLNILFLGMPVIDDNLYQFIPDAAKTAWGSDEFTYANLKSSVTGNRLDITPVHTFLLHRLNIFRDGCPANTYMFYSNSSSDAKTCAIIQHCKFGYKDRDLNDPEFTSNMISDSCMKAYCSFTGLRMLAVNDLIMNYAFTGNSTDSYGIYCQADLLNIENVTINSLLTNINDAYCPLYLFGPSQVGIEADIHDITVNIIENGTCSYIPGMMLLRGFLNSRLYNVQVKMERGLNETHPGQLNLSNMFIGLEEMLEYDIHDITVKFPKLWLVNSSGGILRLSGYHADYVPGVEKNVRNILIELAEENGYGSHNTFSDIQDNGESYAAFRMMSSSGEITLYWKTTFLDNVVIKHPRGKAAYIQYARIANSTFAGSVKLIQVFAELDNLSSWYPGKILYLTGGSQAHIKKLTVNKENPSCQGSYVACNSDYSHLSNVFVEESNTPVFSKNLLSSESYRVYQGFLCTSEETQGHYVFRCPNGIADTWNVHREGGGTACLKLWNDECNTLRTMVLGRKPFKGIILNPTTPGRYMLRVHCACKGYDNLQEIYRRFMISAQVAKTAKISWSNVDGRCVDDPDAVWVNDTGLTQFVLEMPVYLPEVTTVDVRIYFAWYNPQGFVYVDPAMELTLLDND